MPTTQNKPPATPKSKKSKINCKQRGNFLYLHFPRDWSRQFYGEDQMRIALGMQDTQSNRERVAEAIGQINIDCQWKPKEFDKSLAKYGLIVPKLTPKAPQNLTLLEVWQRYCESRIGSLRETTLELDYRGRGGKIIKNALEKKALAQEKRKNLSQLTKSDELTALELFEYVRKNRDFDTAKTFLSRIEKAIDWAIQEENVSPPYGEKNPFRGMSKKIQDTELDEEVDENLDEEVISEFEDCRAFSPEERSKIIEALAVEGYILYAYFILFKFLTGCRTGEALALRWKHIKSDFSQINFCLTYSDRVKKDFPCKTKKNKKEKRRFPIVDSQLVLLLQLLKPTNAKANDLVFSENGGRLNVRRLRVIWSSDKRGDNYGIVRKLAEKGEIRTYLNLYATRHTFISEQLNREDVKNLFALIKTVAEWVGNSPETIFKHYYSASEEIFPFPIAV